jgi:hypothetical protein
MTARRQPDQKVAAMLFMPTVFIVIIDTSIVSVTPPVP